MICNIYDIYNIYICGVFLQSNIHCATLCGICHNGMRKQQSTSMNHQNGPRFNAAIVLLYHIKITWKNMCLFHFHSISELFYKQL